MMPSIVAAVFITVAGTAALALGTDGFRAYTSETARREAILRQPRVPPTAVLEDQDGRIFRLEDYRGKLVAVEFIYTHCATLCRALGTSFQRIRDNVPIRALGRGLVLFSISFDPDRDTPAQLKNYARHFGADGQGWRIARVRDKAALKSLLAAFGIVVVPDGLGGFEHNAAIHLLDPGGRLIEISDYDRPLQFAAKVKAAL